MRTCEVNNMSFKTGTDMNETEVSDNQNITKKSNCYRLEYIYNELLKKDGVKEREECINDMSAVVDLADMKTLLTEDVLVTSDELSHSTREIILLYKHATASISAWFNCRHSYYKSGGDGSSDYSDFQIFVQTELQKFRNEIRNTVSMKKTKSTRLKAIPRIKFKHHLRFPDKAIMGKTNNIVKMKIECTPLQLKHFKIGKRYPNVCVYETTENEKWNHPSITIKELLNWPFIGFTLSLPDLVVSHNVANKYNRMITYEQTVSSDSTILNDTINPHNCDVMQLTEMSSYRLCNLTILQTYLLLYSQALTSILPTTARRREEMSSLIDQVLQDITLAQHIYTDCKYTYSLSKYNYIRKYCVEDDVNTVNEVQNATEESISDMEGRRHRLVEEVHPQCNFSINRCTFESNNVSDHESVLQFFKDISLKKPSAIQKLNETVSKCIEYYCVLCGRKCSGVLACYEIEEHIKALHGSEAPWKCIKCNTEFDAFVLAGQRWKHQCEVQKFSGSTTSSSTLGA